MRHKKPLVVDVIADLAKRDAVGASDSMALVSDFYIIAGNQQQARDYCKSKGILYQPSKVFHAPHCLRGLRGGTVRLIGTYYDRRDWGEFQEMILTRDFKTEVHKY